MTVTAVVFDLDYTLAVPERDRATLLDEASRQTDAPAFTREEYLAAHREHHVHETRAPIFEALLTRQDSDISPEVLADAYRETIAEAIVPVSGVSTLIRTLQTDYAVGLLTNGPVVAQQDKLETLEWTDLFDAVCITGELDAGKPDERAFVTILQMLDVDASEAVYVGDDVDADVRGAKNAGMFAIQVLYDGGPSPDPLADAYVQREEVSDRLQSIIETIE